MGWNGIDWMEVWFCSVTFMAWNDVFGCVFVCYGMDVFVMVTYFMGLWDGMELIG